MSYREEVRAVVLNASDEARVAAYQKKLVGQGWKQDAAEHEAGLLRYNLQRAAHSAAKAAKEAAELEIKRENLRNVRVAHGFGLDERRASAFGAAPVIEAEAPEIKVSELLLEEANESQRALGMTSREMLAAMRRGEKLPQLKTVWGVVVHPEHGHLAVTAAEFDALNMQEYVPA